MIVDHGDSAPLQHLPAEREQSLMCDITISSWGSDCDIKQMIISFQCELAVRHVSTIISRRITEALQRRRLEKDPSIAVAFTAATI